jgi:hypothetical protein
MNYSQLVTEIQNYTENQFATTDINTFIRQAEQRIYNTVQFPSLRKNVTGTITASNKYLSAPSDFLAAYSIAVVDDDNNYQYLLNKDVNFIRSAYPNPLDIGFPEYYALFGPATTGDSPPLITNELSFILGPTPDGAYTVELHYYYYPESITTAATGTSWLGDNFDSVLLYGSLVEAYTYMKGEQDVINLYLSRYQEALGLAKRLGDGMERQDAYRSGRVRIPVR